MHVAPESNTTKTKKATIKNKKILLQDQIRNKTRKEVRKIRKSLDRHSKWLQISRQARPYNFNSVIKRIAIVSASFLDVLPVVCLCFQWSALVLRMARPSRYPPGLPWDGAARAILVHSLFCFCLRVKGLTGKFAQALRCLPQTLGVRSGIAFLDWAPSTSILIKFQFNPFHTIFAHFRCHCLLVKSSLEKTSREPRLGNFEKTLHQPTKRSI